MGRIRVRVTPNSRVEKFAVTNDEIHAWVSGPPVDGRANRRLAELLAERLRVPKSSVAVVVGAGSRAKTVEVAGMTRDQIMKRLSEKDST